VSLLFRTFNANLRARRLPKTFPAVSNITVQALARRLRRPCKPLAPESSGLLRNRMNNRFLRNSVRISGKSQRSPNQAPERAERPWEPSRPPQIVLYALGHAAELAQTAPPLFEPLSEVKTVRPLSVLLSVEREFIQRLPQPEADTRALPCPAPYHLLRPRLLRGSPQRRSLADGLHHSLLLPFSIQIIRFFGEYRPSRLSLTIPDEGVANRWFYITVIHRVIPRSSGQQLSFIFVEVLYPSIIH
jgi:hypothetical protein